MFGFVRQAFHCRGMLAVGASVSAGLLKTAQPQPPFKPFVFCGGDATDSKSVPITSVAKRPAGNTSTKFPILKICDYSKPVQTFKSMTEGRDLLCIGRRIKGHKPMVLETNSTHLHLFCSLRHQSPPCDWRGLLIQVGDSAELRTTPGAKHNELSPPLVQKTGFSSVEQFLKARDQLSATLVVKPNNALFSMRSDDSVDSAGLSLGQLQNLKKKFGGGCRQQIGTLAAFVEKHAVVPTDPREGYFCVHDVSRDAQGKPRITLVATTTGLQARVTANPEGTSAIDGGHGFSIYGWPMTVKGELNRKGELGPTDLIITSTMYLEHMREAIHKSVSSAESVTGRGPKKAFTMSDAEKAYMQTMKEAHGSRSLMCWFHVVSNVREYVVTHAQMPLDDRKLLFTSKILPDLWCLHRSLSEAEFACKVIGFCSIGKNLGRTR
jgi:hypothetical protein